jgi:hypothetical protein
MSTPRSFPSPDGRFVLEIFSVPMRMSHEVECSALFDTASKKSLFDPGDLWAAAGIQWSDDSQTLRMNMFQYPNGSLPYALTLDLEKGTATLHSGDRIILNGDFLSVQRAMVIFEPEKYP